MVRTQLSPRGATMVMLGGGVVAGPLFVVSDLLDALTRADYDVLRHWVSHLALGPEGGLGTVRLVATAVLLAAGAGGVLRRGPRAYPTAVLVAATALAVAATFPMEPSLGFPPGSEPRGDLAGHVHDVAGPVFILALAVAAVLSRRVLSVSWPGLARWGRMTGLGVLLAFVVCSVLVALDYAGSWPSSPSGLFERLAIGGGLLWTSVVAWTVARAPLVTPGVRGESATPSSLAG